MFIKTISDTKTKCKERYINATTELKPEVITKRQIFNLYKNMTKT